jgi:hypothetical protein
MMADKLQSINIHALLQTQNRLMSQPAIQCPSGLQSLVTPLLGDTFSILLTTNKQQGMTTSDFVFLLKISEDILELEEKKAGKQRLFKMLFGSSFLSINQRRAMGDDFKVFADRLKILGIQLQKKPYKFWATFLKDDEGVEAKFQPVQNSDLLSQKTAGALLQLAQKMGRPSPIERVVSTTDNDVLRQLTEVKSLLLSILETSQKVIITNSEIVKNHQKMIYTFSITNKYATFLEKSSVMQNKWELDLVSMKSILNQMPFEANSASWLSMRIESVAQDIVAKKAEMYRK